MSGNEFESKFALMLEMPKPEKLRFFIDKSGLDAEIEYRCSLIGSTSYEIQSKLVIRGGLLSKMIPVSAHEESVRISEIRSRQFVRTTKFKTGQIKEQHQAWEDHDLHSTVEAPWVLEFLWKRLAEKNAEVILFRFFDGRYPSAATFNWSSGSQDRGSGSAKLIVQGKKPIDLDLKFKDWRLREICFQLPMLGSLRLVRHDG